MKSKAWWNDIHTRMAAKDPIAPAELAEEALPVLVKHLRIRFRMKDSEAARDAAADAVMAYVKNPSSFDATARSLLGYLKMSAEGDLQNTFRKDSKRRSREVMKDPVELLLVAGKKDNEAELAAAMDLEVHLAAIDSFFSNDTDRRLARLVLEKERSTEVFAAVLGIASESDTLKRRIVKQHKDRIKKVLRRRGSDENE